MTQKENVVSCFSEIRICFVDYTSIHYVVGSGLFDLVS